MTDLTPMSLNQLSSGQFPIDVSEDEKNYKVRAELPGFNKEDTRVCDAAQGGAMTLSAEIILSKENLIADLSDGRRLEQPDFFKMAQALFQIGVRANRLCFDWRNGTKMITAGTQVAMVAEIRRLESAGRRQSKAA